MKIDFNRLNEGQKQSVMAKDGVYQIISVAGSGKTSVLTNRVIYLIGHHQVDPSNILLTTFSKKAAEEIKERMGKMVNKRVLDEITISTFHAIGNRILKFEYKKLNHPMLEALEKGPISGKPQKWMIEAIMKDLNYPESKDGLNAAEALRVISLAKNECIDVDKFSVECIEEKDFKIAEIYKAYETKKKEEKIIDYDDMLILLYELFRDHPTILAKYQHKFKYIMVDEAQDNNRIQYMIIKMLGEKYKNIFIVGDDDQSMYGFRGAKSIEFVNFKKNYENVTIINLEINYRSLPLILDVSNKLIEKNTIRLPKKIVAFHGKSEKSDEVKYFDTENEDTEAEIVAEKIQKLVSEGQSYKDCAVLFRTSAQTRAIEDHFIRNAIPYVIYGGMSFYERAEVKDIIAYMNLAVNPHDNESFERVVNTPSRYLGKAFVNSLKMEARKRKCSLYDAMKTVKLTSYQHRNGMSYYDLIGKLNSFVKQGASAVNVIKEIRNLTGYDDYLLKETKEEDNDVLENLNSLESASVRHNSPKDFLNFIKILTKSKLENANAVQMMTVHKSKGLEFPFVSVIGFSNNLMPHKYAMESGDPIAIEEERRLAYVALTRAKNEVNVSSIKSYNGKRLEPSIFVSDCSLTDYLN